MISIAAYIEASPHFGQIKLDYFSMGALDAARKWHHLWPEKSLDAVRKAIDYQFNDGRSTKETPRARELRLRRAAEKIQEKAIEREAGSIRATQEMEQKVLASIEEMAREAIDICKSNALNAHKIAKEHNDYRGFVASSQALAPAMALLGRMVHQSEQSPTDQTESGFLKGYMTNAESFHAQKKSETGIHLDETKPETGRDIILVD